MENNNPVGLSQWNVFCSQHCRVWFGVVKEFDALGKCTDCFRVMRAFKPKQNDSLSEIVHSNVYYYDDERGTVTSSPRCGPWFYKEEDSTSIGFKGVKHAKWPHTKYIFFPSGSGIMFNNSALNYGSVETCIKLFLHHPKRPNIRLSLMLEYQDFNLHSFRVYLENSDGWKSDFWDQQSLSEPSSLPAENLISHQAIDSNLEISSRHESELETKKTHDTNVFSFEPANVASLFEHTQPGYLTFNPSHNVTLTCPRSMKPRERSNLEATSPTSLSSPVSPSNLNSFVGVRWSLRADGLSTDFVAQFDTDTRFMNLTELVYSSVPLNSL